MWTNFPSFSGFLNQWIIKIIGKLSFLDHTIDFVIYGQTLNSPSAATGFSARWKSQQCNEWIWAMFEGSNGLIGWLKTCTNNYENKKFNQCPRKKCNDRERNDVCERVLRIKNRDQFHQKTQSKMFL
jgi:hypothetical protein